MKIVISVESLDPPLGRVTTVPGDPAETGDGGDGVEFVGWLGLLRLLDELIGQPGRAPEIP
jgi:hypothetical protein